MLRSRVFILIVTWFLVVNFLLLWFRAPENSMDLILAKIEFKGEQNASAELVQTQQKPGYSMNLRDDFKHDLIVNSTKESVTEVVTPVSELELQFHIVDSVSSSIPIDSKIQYVVVIPRRINTKSMIFNQMDGQQSAILTARSVLNALSSLDGVACLPQKMKPKILNRHSSVSNQTMFFNTSWCNFARREWSIQIRNSGELKQLELRPTDDKKSNYPVQHTNYYQLCNIIDGPFVLRKNKFMEINGLRSDFGRLSLLDFFLRSNGKLKIGKLGNCFFNDDLFYRDRGNLEGSDDFPEYSNFGVHHNVLRIIMEDRIEWTKCVATSKHCKEQPYVPPTTLPQIGQPICCSVLLAKMLHDIVAVFTKLDIDYRLIYGTLLGAERSGAIIPYTHDIDFAVDYRISHNRTRYDALQKYFYDKYYISSNFMEMPRLIPLIPVYLDVQTTQFFNGELDLKGDKFFSPEILSSIEGLLPVSGTFWRTRGYADFYPGWDAWWNSSSTTFIDGVEYRTVKEKEYEVTLWYGKNWKEPILKSYDKQSDVGAVSG